jgi:transcription-repair coupling factor (superfamily II helicase)
MDLSGLLPVLRGLPGYQALLGAVQGDDRRGLRALSIPRSARPALIAALSADISHPIVVFTSRSDRSSSLIDELQAWTPHAEILPFSDPNPLFYEFAAWGPRTISTRARVLARLTDGLEPAALRPAPGRPLIIVAPVRAAITRTLARRDFIAGVRWLRAGGAARLDRLTTHLLGIGYQPHALALEPGHFSRRGGILDLWPPADEQPARLEFVGDQVETLRRFDPASQRSTAEFDALRITPAREGLPRLFQPQWLSVASIDDVPDPGRQQTLLEFFLAHMNPGSAGLLDYLPQGSGIIFEDYQAFRDGSIDLEERAVQTYAELYGEAMAPDTLPLPYLTLSEMEESLEEFAALDMASGSPDGSPAAALAARFAPGPRFGGQIKTLLDHLVDRRLTEDRVVVISRQAQRVAELWSEIEGAPVLVEEGLVDLHAGQIRFLQGEISEGWIVEVGSGSALHVLSDAEIFGWARPQPRARPRPHALAPEFGFADFQAGMHVVHVDHGIGRFVGLVERTLEEMRREFLLIEYANGAQLYVPIHQTDRIAAYLGSDDAAPTLSHLGTQEWERTKARVQQATEDVARDLLELYARRMTAMGHAFPADTPWQQELEASFPYIETEDQLQAIQAVKADMERRLPMDRLICGDVGYGKTEVGLRAAFKAVMDSKQVAILVPTTVLAQQHFNTFRRRLAPFPIQVEMLSRFRTPAEAQAIAARLAQGEIDIIVGTHRLLQRDIAFRDLGLLIVDEEQRFGVTHKEFLKRLRTEIDVLTMTATPIPRTLYLALTGARDISNINTPPEERLPVVTQVGPYDSRVVRQAILRELDRGGQCYFVHNRVQTIGAVLHRLQALVPEARIEIGHGQMPERQLEQVMERFATGEIDVLLSTSIIESGLDYPNANTLIVDRADAFGLAQLYQLRGRVGRSASRAYAYLFRHPRVRPSPGGRERLEIIAEHGRLGAGYSIAMRDLEMRGAGDILGTRQHGHVAAVGFHLYTRLLGQAVRRLKGELRIDAGGRASSLDEIQPIQPPLEVSIELPLSAALPESYINDRELRLQLYIRLAGMRRREDIQAFRSELRDRFGRPPQEVDHLLYQMQVKLLASEAGVQSITTERKQLLLHLEPELASRSLPQLGPEVRDSKRGIWLPRDGQPPGRNACWMCSGCWLNSGRIAMENGRLM